MKISQLSANMNFGRAFTKKEREKAVEAQNKAKKLLDIDKVIIITPEVSLPASEKNTGVGSLNSKTSENFYRFMQSYAGINNIKLLPQGELRNNNGFYCAYSATGLTLGSHTINLEELTSDEMGNILSKETFDKVASIKDKNIANYENVVGKESPHYKALEEAFNNFKNSNSSKLSDMKSEFEKYKSENSNIVENQALFEILAEQNGTRNFKEWNNQTDRELFNEEIIPLKDRNKRIAELKTANSDKIEFAYFRQYLADKNLANAKKKLNENGLKLYGDCLIGFSAPEIWANPKAFEKNGHIASADWGINSLNFPEITNENSASYKLLKQKVAGFAKRYDAIRFDVGWAYCEPIVYSNDPKSLEGRYNFDSKINAYRLSNKLEGKLLDKIENIVKEVKGADFDSKNLIYEVEAGADEFCVYDWNKNSVIEPFKNRTIVQSTCYLDKNYATIDMMENRMKIPRENYILMAGNHDHIALHALANGKDNDNILKNGGNDIRMILENQYLPLSNELKIDKKILKNSPQEFIKAKFAQLFLAKNIKLFFADIYGMTEQFDSQENNTSKNYRLRIPADYEEAYHKALQENNGFNLYESLASAMKAKGLDKTNKKLYKELVNYGKILREKGALTEETANKQIHSKLIKNKSKFILGGIIAIIAIGSLIHNVLKTKNS